VCGQSHRARPRPAHAGTAGLPGGLALLLLHRARLAAPTWFPCGPGCAGIGAHWSDADWSALRRELLDFYLTPYSAAFYHDDTKALNILLDPAAPPGQRLWWIDVEGVIAGGRLTRYRMLRNLAQLNGSLRSWVPERERLAFLRGVAWHFPWLHEPRVAERLRAWTRRRLLREVQRICGP
jgi:hypothetical protein